MLACTVLQKSWSKTRDTFWKQIQKERIIQPRHIQRNGTYWFLLTITNIRCISTPWCKYHSCWQCYKYHSTTSHTIHISIPDGTLRNTHYRINRNQSLLYTCDNIAHSIQSNILKGYIQHTQKNLLFQSCMCRKANGTDNFSLDMSNHKLLYDIHYTLAWCICRIYERMSRNHSSILCKRHNSLHRHNPHKEI